MNELQVWSILAPTTHTHYTNIRNYVWLSAATPVRSHCRSTSGLNKRNLCSHFFFSRPVQSLFCFARCTTSYASVFLLSHFRIIIIVTQFSFCRVLKTQTKTHNIFIATRRIGTQNKPEWSRSEWGSACTTRGKKNTRLEEKRDIFVYIRMSSVCRMCAGSLYWEMSFFARFDVREQKRKGVSTATRNMWRRLWSGELLTEGMRSREYACTWTKSTICFSEWNEN